jgi:hypothetical protein
VTFRERLLETLRAVSAVLEVPGVMVVGSEVPNLLEPGAASTLVVSQDVDLGVPVAALPLVKERLATVRGLRPSVEERSVWVPEREPLIEVNFLGVDASLRDAGDTYVLEDPDLPLMVFGLLGWLRPGPAVEVDGLRLPLPRTATLLAEKLATERTGEKGDRDLLVALGLLLVATPQDLAELDDLHRGLSPELRHAMRSNLTVLSLLEPRDGMPDPGPHRERLARVLRRWESGS